MAQSCMWTRSEGLGSVSKKQTPAGVGRRAQGPGPSSQEAVLYAPQCQAVLPTVRQSVQSKAWKGWKGCLNEEVLPLHQQAQQQVPPLSLRLSSEGRASEGCGEKALPGVFRSSPVPAQVFSLGSSLPRKRTQGK